jgi:alpha-N-arabinofuranosidase
MNHIKIDLERIVSDIDRNIFGGYMEIGFRDTKFEYLDIGDSPKANKSKLRSDVRAALERANFSNIRFGGDFFSAYHWMDGVGPQNERPARFSQAQNCLVSNQYGTNEFIQFCRAMNIEPYLCANCGDGDMREAADWVEYCNGTGETALVKLRQKHGYAAPHKVKYWGIGNEVDGPHQIGYKTPQEYARAYTEFSKVMKRVDPDIKLVASAVCLWEDQPPRFLDQKSEWVERAQLMLEQAGDRIDYMAFHRYSHPYVTDTYEDFMACAADFNDRLSAYEGLIRAVSLERGIKHTIGIAVDEWSGSHDSVALPGDSPVKISRDEWGVMHLPPNQKSTPRVKRERTIELQDALVTAMHFNAFIRHADSVRLANFTSMPTSWGLNSLLVRPDSPLLLDTTFYPLELYSRTCGQLALDVFWYGETFSGTFRNRAYTGILTLDVTATLDKSRKQLVVYVVNQSREKAMETTITLTSGQFTGNARVSVLNGPDIKSDNTFDNPNRVGIKEATIKASGKSFTYTFESHSVTALVCDIG